MFFDSAPFAWSHACCCDREGDCCTVGTDACLFLKSIVALRIANAMAAAADIDTLTNLWRDRGVIAP
jgi:hypothetical protein